MQPSMSAGYDESTIDDLNIKYGLDATCGGAFLYRLEKLGHDDWSSRLRDINDAVISMTSKQGLPDKPVVCTIDYTNV